MSIQINSCLFSDEYTGLPSGNGSDTGVSYLMGCVGDLIWCNIDFYVSWSALDILADFTSTSKTITRKNCGILSGSFIQDGFQKGDTIIITGASDDNGTYTIASVTDSVITTVENITIDGSFTGVNIYGVTTVNYFDFYYNCVGNNNQQTFKSLTDSKATQKFSGTSSIYYAGSATLQPNSTSRAWWNNEISGINSLPVITQLGTTADYKQHFTLQFPFLITPLFLSNQLQILQNSYKQGGLNTATSTINTITFDQPEYFTEQCLKFIYQIDAKFKITNPTVDHSTQNTVTFNDGNTAWFNSFFPSGVYLDGNTIVKQVYDLKSIAYTDSDSNVLNSFDIENITHVHLLIQSNQSESLINAPFVLNFMWLPTDSAKYQGYSQPNQADFREVFLHDRCKTTLDTASVNGDKFGTSTQALTNVVAEKISGLRFTVDFDINLGSLSKSTFENDGVNNRNYLIWITPQSPDCTKLENSDRSAVLVDVNQAFLDTDDPTLLTIITDGTTDSHYFRYPDTEIHPVTNFDAFLTEYGLLRNQFKIKPNCIIQDVSIYTVVQVGSDDIYNDTIFSEFAIDQWVNNTSGFWDGTENNITINQTRGFDLPDGSKYNVTSINARPDLIGMDGQLVYELIYGFQLGYQYWQQLSNFPEYVNNYPTQYYPAYTVGTTSRGVAPKQPWVSVNPPGKRTKTKHKIVWNILDTSTGIVTEFIHYSDISAYDEQSNPIGNTVTIGTQDQYGSNLGGIIASDVPTNITAILSGDFSIPGGYSSVIGELSASYQVGNKTIFDRITTLDNSPETSNSLWVTKLGMTLSSDYSQGILVSTFDASKSTLPITNVRIYAKISYKV